ncbi:hypothetical protein K435DRAFT_780461 [Dendrothele bispora CBS 962.96]|uniref:F-box domain-containing protein n=1 Tax=Dendrothele bispora (strain CBS 962.96) TaxID=1314807 RepID=A0A4S8LRD6_DENBC|nr:hypothetical protein K435DRAFT_780461 [Dendrothele bispora CBS 962.96]
MNPLGTGCFKPKFPAEIFDLIVDHLYDDRNTLLACSLCRELQPASRFHLFSDLSIKPFPEDLLTLIDILCSPNNTMAIYVQRLVFSDLTKFVLYHGVSDMSRALRFIPRLISFIPQVKTLHLLNTDFEHLPQDIIHSLLSHFTTFTDVRLQFLHFYRFSEFVELACSFPVLERIEIKRLTWTHNGRNALSLRRMPSVGVQWDILELKRGGNLRDLAEWLAVHDNPPQLRSLCYDAASATEVSYLRQLVQRTASSLRNLQVSFPIFVDSARVSETLHEFINLNDCTSLRSLHYKHVLIYPGDAVTSLISPWLSASLSQVRSDLLETIDFELMVPTYGDETCLQELDWEGISKVLLEKQFKYLKMIRFNVCMCPGTSFDSSRAAKFIMDQLSPFKPFLALKVAS